MIACPHVYQTLLQTRLKMQAVVHDNHCWPFGGIICWHICCNNDFCRGTHECKLLLTRWSEHEICNNLQIRFSCWTFPGFATHPGAMLIHIHTNQYIKNNESEIRVCFKPATRRRLPPSTKQVFLRGQNEFYQLPGSYRRQRLHPNCECISDLECDRNCPECEWTNPDCAGIDPDCLWIGPECHCITSIC
jgi:hypothetical protein